MVDIIPVREPNSRGGRGKATFENKKEKQNSSERTPDIDATTSSQPQSLQGTARNIKTRESTSRFAGSTCLLQSFKNQ